MNHHEIRLPEFMCLFITAKPEFLTHVAETISGRNCRFLSREKNLQRYSITNCRVNYEQFEQFNNFFKGRRGQYYSFRLRDLADCKVTKQLIAIGDGNGREYQLYKLYPDPINPYKRPTKKLVENTVKIYLDDQEIKAKVDLDTGIVMLNDNLPKQKKLVADFTFDVQVRFCQDSFEYTYSPDGSIELKTIELVEINQ